MAHDLGTLWIKFGDAAQTCARLAREQQVPAALDLAQRLFDVSSYDVLKRARQRETYLVGEGLGTVIPDLIKNATSAFLNMLLASLNTVSAFEARQHGVRSDEKEYDASTWWRPAIEEHIANRPNELSNVYVGGLRDALESAIEGCFISLREAQGLLKRFDRLVFRRLAIHLVCEFANSDIEMTQQEILTKSYLDADFGLKHEYARLCGKRFHLLTPEQRSTWFAWIELGPEMSEFDASFERGSARKPTDKDRIARIEYWQFQRLHWVRENLEGKWKSFYDQKVKEEGKPRFSDLDFETGFRVGSESPVTVDQLAAMSFPDVVALLIQWSPESQDPIAPSIEGLATIFGNYLSAHLSDVIAQATLLQSANPAYVRSFIDAMRNGVDHIIACDLSPLIELCSWTVEKTARGSDRSKAGQANVSWQWCRTAVSALIEALCDKSASMRYRDSLWALIAALVQDEDDFRLGAKGDDIRAEDFTMLSLNSSCGKAIHAMFAYARWVAHSKTRLVEGKEIVDGGFAAMPEVKELLERLIVPDDSRGFALRASVGWFWPRIYWIDSQWLRTWAGAICDLRVIEADRKRAYGWAAWNTFLASTSPHIEYYQILREQFNYAVDQASTAPINDSRWINPFFKLAEHLIVLYGRGQLDLESDEKILQRLISHAEISVRTHSIRFAGQVLWENEKPEDISAEAKERLMALWDWYWPTVGKADAKKSHATDTFGYWFASGAFDEKWAIERLQEFIAEVPSPHPDTEIVKTLSKICEVDLVRSVQILNTLVESDKERWHIYGWHDGAMSILSRALGDPDAALQAEQLIDRLGRRGFLEFGELLKR
jgi:hypothetical protein